MPIQKLLIEMCLLPLRVLRIDHKVIVNSGGRIYKS